MTFWLVYDPYVKGTTRLEDVLQGPEAFVLATNHSAFDLASVIDRSVCSMED